MAAITTRNGTYILDWRDAQGRHRKTLGAVGILPKKKVDDILKAKQLELSTGAHLLNFRTSQAMPFDSLCQEYMVWHQAKFPSSTERIQHLIRLHLIPAFGFMAIDMIGETEVDIYEARRMKDVKTQTVIKEIRTLKAILNYAVKKRYMPESMAAYVEMPKVLDSAPHLFYESDQMISIYGCAQQQHMPIWKLFANTGMRRSEGLILMKSWIGREEMKILSTEEDRTKSGKWREIPLADGAKEALDQIKCSGGRLLPQINPRSMSRAALNDIRKAKQPGSLHTFRHTYISHLVRSGVPLRTVQIYAGHASYVTTESYAYLAPGNKPEQALRLSL